MKITLSLCALLLLAGCERGSYGELDNKIICDSGKAYYIERNIGQTSFVKRFPQKDQYCGVKK